MSNTQEDNYVCPSFSSYSSGSLAEIAVRVAVDNSGDKTEDEDFEFALIREDQEVLLENFFDHGQIGAVFPIFNRDLDNGGKVSIESENAVPESSAAIPLSEFFIEEDIERDNNPPSCSSSDADELENIPAGTYCVWRPELADSPMPSQCKKSKSTGSVSRRWKIRDLMRRCNSDGKDSFVFLTPKHREQRPEKSSIHQSKHSKGKVVLSSGAGTSGPPSAHEAFYVRNRAAKEVEKKKSYLPYRQDLVGFFANVNGLRRSFPRF